MVSQSTDDAVVASAFELIPAGKKVGDSWADSSSDKDMKAVRTYTLKAINGNEATIGLTAVTTASNKLNFQDMEMELKSNTKTTGDIITDIKTGQVKKRSSKSEISGTVQMMGQDVPVSVTATTESTYQ